MWRRWQYWRRRERDNAECGVRNAECQWKGRFAIDLSFQFRIPHSAFRTRAGRGGGGPERRRSRAGPAVVRAPMPGLVVRVEVADGQRVEAGAGLVVVEAMKMENELRAPRAGVVQTVHVAVGQAVEKGMPLVTVASPEPSG